jgi:proteasome beta subunit
VGGVTLPLFSPTDDPGPSFVSLLTKLGADPFQTVGSGNAGDNQLGVPHSTTICAIRFADGVLMAGDRRATMGNVIAHRSMEKVLQADKFSGVAIAGSAGLAMEMVKLFQLQLEHYEKSEGDGLSLEGKANQLAQFVKSNLAMAMQGFVVVPLFAGYDERRGTGRIYTYDATGGRYEEANFHADGSGGRDAKTTIKLGYKDDLSRKETIALALRALYEAADEDSATGGPDKIRGIYPMVATITAKGFVLVEEDEIATIFDRIIKDKSK